MDASKPTIDETWVDPDDAPEWTDEHFKYAQFSIGGKIIREASGTWTKPGRPISANPKKQVTLRLDSEVLEALRATGRGWQSRVNAELRKVLGL
jgi:uncharacterized protein (DUF4415 family)